MQQITDLSSDAKQTFKIQIEDGKLATFKLYYSDNQIGWFLDVEYEGVVSKGLRLTNNPNVLSAYLNLIRVGLACQVTDGQEPYFQNDFTSGRVNLYILTEAEAILVKEEIYAKV